MKLEPGKYYRTRLGEKAYVCGVAPDEFFGDKCCMVLGYVISEDGVWNLKSWKKEGDWDNVKGTSFDLVSEWTEPEEVEVTIYRTPGGNILVYQGEPMEGQEDMFKIVKKLKVTLD